MAPEGWHGWDEYAPFYDWENRRTLGRRDLPFWLRLAEEAAGPVLELGCGTGRLSLAVARRAPRFVGIDRSPTMLERIRKRLRRARLGSRALLVRGDVRALPFQPSARFGLVMAPYGLAQSLLRDRDLDAALVAGECGADRILVPVLRGAHGCLQDPPLHSRGNVGVQVARAQRLLDPAERAFRNWKAIGFLKALRVCLVEDRSQGDRRPAADLLTQLDES